MKCICCDKKISLLHSDKLEEDILFDVAPFGENTSESKCCWKDGIVGRIYSGYGSKLDGNVYIIAVCDECIEVKTTDGTVAFVDQYMFPTYWKDEKNKYKSLWRRYNSLDNLI